MTDYHEIPALSATLLKTFIRSRPQFIQRVFGTASKQTDAMRLGTLAHMATLEPTLYAAEVKVWSETRTKGKRFREWAESIDGTPATEAEDAQALAISNAVWSDDIANCYLDEDGPVEVPVFAKTVVDGMHTPLKCKPDKLIADAVIDLKTTSDPSPDAFNRQIANLMYWAQAWLYLQITGRDRFVFIAVRNVEPYDVGTYEIVRDDPTWVMADEICKRALRDMVRCFREGDFRDPWMKSTQPVELPGWYARSMGVE